MGHIFNKVYLSRKCTERCVVFTATKVLKNQSTLPQVIAGMGATQEVMLALSKGFNTKLWCVCGGDDVS